MELKKLAPWNWFKKEDEESGAIPVQLDTEHHGSAVQGAYHPVTQLQRSMDHLFNALFRESGLSAHRHPGLLTAPGMPFLRPSVNVGGDDREYDITVEIPGVDEKDIKIEVVDDIMTISGEKRQESEKQQKGFYRMERSYGAFRRVLTLPDDADTENISARFRQGVLHITIGKRMQKREDVKRIAISSEA